MRQDKKIQDMASQFVFLRMTRMNGVDLNLFTFDRDLTWMSFFLNADGVIYSRYGGRDDQSAEARLSAAGLLHTMQAVLALHKTEANKKRAPVKARTAEDIPAMKKMMPFRGSDCIHCHMVPHAEYAQQRQEGTFKKDSLWIYPLPENIGLTLDLVEGNRIKQVKAGSFADKGGLKPGDLLQSANGILLLTPADLEHALNAVAADGKLEIKASRQDKPVSATLKLTGNWKHRDLSWRKSIRELQPVVGFYGGPLKPDDKARLKIPADDLAFRLQYVHPPSAAGKAGLRAGDVIVAVDGKKQVPYRQLRSYFPLEHQSGDKVEVRFLRGSQEQTVTLQLP